MGGSVSNNVHGPLMLARTHGPPTRLVRRSLLSWIQEADPDFVMTDPIEGDWDSLSEQVIQTKLKLVAGFRSDYSSVDPDLFRNAATITGRHFQRTMQSLLEEFQTTFRDLHGPPSGAPDQARLSASAGLLEYEREELLQRVRVVLIPDIDSPAQNQTRETFLSPFFFHDPVAIPNSETRFVTALTIGPFLLQWHRSSLVLPRQVDCFPIVASSRDFSVRLTTEVQERISQVLSFWNCSMIYEEKTPGVKRYKGNSQNFVDDLLFEVLKDGHEEQEGEMGLAVEFSRLPTLIQNVRANGSTTMSFMPSASLYSHPLFSNLLDSMMTFPKCFESHVELDGAILGFADLEDVFKHRFEKDFMWLKAIDRLWMYAWHELTQFQGDEYEEEGERDELINAARPYFCDEDDGNKMSCACGNECTFGGSFQTLPPHDENHKTRLKAMAKEEERRGIELEIRVSCLGLDLTPDIKHPLRVNSFFRNTATVGRVRRAVNLGFPGLYFSRRFVSRQICRSNQDLSLGPPTLHLVACDGMDPQRRTPFLLEDDELPLRKLGIIESCHFSVSYPDIVDLDVSVTIGGRSRVFRIVVSRSSPTRLLREVVVNGMMREQVDENDEFAICKNARSHNIDLIAEDGTILDYSRDRSLNHFVPRDYDPSTHQPLHFPLRVRRIGMKTSFANSVGIWLDPELQFSKGATAEAYGVGRLEIATTDSQVFELIEEVGLQNVAVVIVSVPSWGLMPREEHHQSDVCQLARSIQRLAWSKYQFRQAEEALEKPDVTWYCRPILIFHSSRGDTKKYRQESWKSGFDLFESPFEFETSGLQFVSNAIHSREVWNEVPSPNFPEVVQF